MEATETHTNEDAQTDWLIPTEKSYNTFLCSQIAGLKGWPYLNDNRLVKKGRSRRAPMCVRFQAMGDCTHGCTLAHMRASDMPEADRKAVAKRFLELYG